MKPDLKIIHVIWWDANGGARRARGRPALHKNARSSAQDGWKPLSAIGGGPTRTHSTGLLLKDDVERLIVVPHWTEEGHGDGEITIPKGCVESVEILGDGGKP